MEIAGTIAIEAQQLKPAILWKAVFAQPAIELAATTSNFSMLSSIVIRVIDRQNFGACLTTTYAFFTVSGQSFLAEISVPNLHTGFLSRLTIDILEPVAVGTEQLKALFRKTLLTKPQVEPMTVTSNTAMLSAIVVNVVHRKENEVLGYTKHTVRTYFLIVTPGMLLASVLRTLIKHCQATSFLPQVYPNLLSIPKFSTKLLFSRNTR